jgi:hypothetical protein
MKHLQLLRNLATVAAVTLSGSGIAAENSAPANTLKLAAGMSPPVATIDAVKWIAGSWRGDAFGGVAEEMWGQPEGDSMMGSYRLVIDGKVIFYEIQTIVEQDNSLVFRLKHFNPDLSGWEEQQAAAAVSFPLVKIARHEVYFDGLTFRKLDNGSLQVFLRTSKSDQRVVEEEFLYHPLTVSNKQ